MGNHTPVAVVGLGALLPGADGVGPFWRNVVSGRDLITEIPETHWRIEDYYDPDPAAPDRTYGRRGAFLDPVDFEPLTHGVPPNALPGTDTSQSLALVAAVAALQDATGGDLDRLDRERTAVILGTSVLELYGTMTSRMQRPQWLAALRESGVSEDLAQTVCDRIAARYVPWQEATFPGLLSNVVAGRIANRLDLHGTNHVTDAACASSFAALRTAVNELALGQADVVLTGGVDTLNDISMYMCFAKTSALSESGDCRPFSAGADGTMLGEGLAMFVLKRLADAERDGDRVYAVLRGIGSSSDGRGTAIYAPAAAGQVRALRRAYEQAGYGPESVDLVEAHGTGTRAGDAAEFAALREVFAETGRTDGPWCALGSVKSQIGHTKAAAGAVGLLKAVLAVHHKVLPPTIKVDRPNPVLGIESSPLYLNTRARPWVRDAGAPRRAAVSSFGFGGSNFHVTIEEYTGEHTPRRYRDTPTELLVLGAPDLEHLGGLLDALEASDESLEVLTRRSQEDFDPSARVRLAIVATGKDDLAAKAAAIRARASGGGTGDIGADVCLATEPAAAGPIAFLFPGQGSQYVGMGADLAMAFPAARAVWDAARAVRLTDRPLDRVVFPPPAFDEDTRAGHEATLTATEWAQPALGAVSLATMAVLDACGVRADRMAGHSFGELTALHAAGVVEASALLRMARRRGEAMRDAAARPGAPDGLMLAVRATLPRIAPYLGANGHRQVWLANDNGPEQVVLSGSAEAVAAVADRLRADSVHTTPLHTATAFHTPLMAAARAELAAFLDSVPFAPPRLPVYGNADAARYPEDADEIRRRLADHLTKPVRFREMVQRMHADGVRTFVEVGAGSTLTGLVSRVLAGKEHVAISTDRRGCPGVTSLHRALGRLAVRGVPIGFAALWDGVYPPRTLPRPSPKMTIPLTGANYGKPDLPPTPSPTGRPSPSRSDVDDTRRSRVLPGPGPAADPGLSESRPAGPTQSTLHVPLPEEMTVHDDLRASEVHTLSEIARQAADAHTHYHRLATEAHLAFLRMSETTISHLAGVVPMPADPPALPASAPQDREAVPARPSAVPGSFPVGGSGVSAESVAEPAPPPAPAAAPAPEPVAAPAEAPVPVPSELGRKLLEVVADKTGYPVEMLNTGLDLESDLGIDSIKRVEILSTLRRDVPGLPELDAGDLAALRSLEQIVRHLENAPGLLGADPGKARAAEVDPTSVAPQPAPSHDVPDADSHSRYLDARHRLAEQLEDRTRIWTPRALLTIADECLELSTVVDRLSRALSARANPGPSRPATEPPEVRSVRLRPLPAPDRLESAYGESPVALVIDHGGGETDAVVNRLKAVGWTVHVGTAGDEPPVPERLDLCLDLLTRTPDWESSIRLLTGGILLAGRVVPALRRSEGRAAFVTVTRLDGRLGHAEGTDPATAILGGISGLVKTLAREEPGLFCRTVDIAAELTPGQLADALLAELSDAAVDVTEVGLDGSGRCTVGVGTAVTEPVGTPELSLSDVVVVTGGARGVTAVCVRALAAEVPCTFLLLGRTPLTPEPDWAAGVPPERLRDAVIASLPAGQDPARRLREVRDQHRELLAQREIRETLDALTSAGATVRYVEVDVTDPAATHTALARAGATVLVHGAGVLADSRIADKTADSVGRVLAPKLRGLRNVIEALDGSPLRRVILFGSVAGLFGNIGQADYAVANEALARFAATHRGRVTAIDWGAWDGGMVGAELRALFESRGIVPIPPERGARVFVDRFTTGAVEPRVLVGPSEPLHGPDEPPPRAPFTAVRDLAPLAGDPVLGAHRIGAALVLPATFALGWMIRTLEQRHPGLRVIASRDFRVYRGIVFHTAPGGRYRVRAEPDDPEDGRPRLRVTIAGPGDGSRPVPHYGATLVLDSRPVACSRLTGLRGERAGFSPYQDGILFHGPDLRGVVAEHIGTGHQAVFECRLPDRPVAAGAFAGRSYSPVLSDLLLHGPTILAHRLLGHAALPLAIDHAEFHAPLPDDEPFLIVLDDTRRGEFDLTVTVTAAGLDGRLLQRFTGVSVVATPAMATKFAEGAAAGSARSRTPEAMVAP